MWISSAIFLSTLILEQAFLTSGKSMKIGNVLSKAPIIVGIDKDADSQPIIVVNDKSSDSDGAEIMFTAKTRYGKI